MDANRENIMVNTIDLSKRGSTLIVGNGIVRLFDNQKACDNLICEMQNEFGIDVDSKVLESLPFTSRIVAATGDNVDKAMSVMSKQWLKEDIQTEERRDYMLKILNLAFEDIITTNYTYELEQAAGVKPSSYYYSRCSKNTIGRTEKDTRFHLFRYSNLAEYNKRVWHIHGELVAPKSIIIGQYYYGKLLSEIQKYIPGLMRRYKYCKKNGIELDVNSWIDSFFLNDLYILGFSFAMSELDIWWLLCCKKRNFPDTKVHFYSPSDTMDNDIRVMLETYGVIIEDSLGSSENYRTFYDNAILDISQKISAKYKLVHLN